jgi:WD40 repeat protein
MPDDSGVPCSSDKLSFATASADGTAKLWNMSGTCMHTCAGHTGRLGRIAFHPMGLLPPFLHAFGPPRACVSDVTVTTPQTWTLADAMHWNGTVWWFIDPRELTRSHADVMDTA